MKESELTRSITDLISAAFLELDKAGAIAISPDYLARQVYKLIDPSDSAPPHSKHLAILQLRQQGRAFCRRRQEEQETRAASEHKQDALFEDFLQPRYPAHRDSEEVYVLLNHLSLDEHRANVERLERTAQGYERHRRALEAHGVQKFGDFYRARLANS